MGAATTPATERPMFLSADKRKISYKSKNGSTITLEFKNKAAPSADSVLQLTKKKPALDTDLKVKAGDNATEAAANEGKLWLGVYDTLSFWVMEAMEIAAFGPYDEPAV